MSFEKKHWLRTALQIKGSVLLQVLPRSLFCGGFALLITIAFVKGQPVSLPALASLIPNIVLGLLLVFRTNTAYDRFWEGRKAWGKLVNDTRNLARQIWVAVAEVTEGDRAGKIEALYLLVAFSVAVKSHLRQEPLGSEIEVVISLDRVARLKGIQNPPLRVAFWIADYLQLQYQRDRVKIHQLTEMQRLLDGLVDSLGACERILKTPMPIAYAIHLKQLILLYCLSLPFQMVESLGWWTPPVVVLISFTLFGIEAIGIEIENPFGRDPNDLPLDAICETMLKNIQDLTELRPSNHPQDLPLIAAYEEQQNGGYS
ncbi:bestrophin family ion channel [Leptolyngbya sp. DQ-M1]|uniref:bestrophin family protein n=1 Tax=Leptolyngbya sp. DQ-M1 TaxID=2933920 RepID=UPI003298CABA